MVVGACPKYIPLRSYNHYPSRAGPLMTQSSYGQWAKDEPSMLVSFLDHQQRAGGLGTRLIRRAI